MSSVDQPEKSSPPARHQPALRPPGTMPGSPSATAAAHRKVWLALGALVLVALVVMLLLPRLVSDRGPGTDSPAIEPPEPPPTGEQVDTSSARRQAELKLQQFLRLQAELRLANAPVWAATEWNQTEQQAGTGDHAFGERRFEEAGRRYAEAVAGLQEVKASRPLRLEQVLAGAREALDRHDSELAQQQFEIAIAMDPENEEAGSGLERARVRDQVLEQLAAAEQAERNSDLEQAGAAYRAALALDPLFSPARAGLAETERRIQLRTFNAAMNRALTALDERRFKAAGQALEEAARIDAENPALVDLRNRIRLARRQATLERLRRDALGAVRSEDWQAAIQSYRRALGIDGSAGFARQGLAHAEQRAKLHQQVDHYLDDPARLFDQQPLANAEQLLAALPAAPAKEPRLAAKIDRLKKQVQEARTPLPVMLHSDGETEVVVYHVGRLGRFAERQLELKPGTYTAVGSRPGYRDVRQVFSVQPGQGPVRVVIRCEEPV